MEASRQFSVEVDERHRAKRLRFFSLEKPHARAFHAGACTREPARRSLPHGE
jgi:hypothetical protein